MKKILFILLSIISLHSINAQIFNDDIKSILVLQDSRILGENNILLSYLNSNSEEIIIKTLVALSNIQDTTTVFAIQNMLNHKNIAIRKQAAYTLGEIYCYESKLMLENSLLRENEIEVKKEIINSLGKVGDNNSLEILTSLDNKNDEINSAIALSIARFAIRKIKSERAIDFLKNILKTDFGNQTENNIAYAFFRIRDEKLLYKAEEDLKILTGSNSPFTRMWAYYALGYIGNPENLSIIYNNYKNETDWRVKVNILNSLMNYINKNNLCISDNMADLLLEGKNDNNVNVRITALKQIGEIFSKLPENNKLEEKILLELESCFNKNISLNYYEIGEALLAYAKIKKDKATDFLLKFLAETDNYALKPYIITSFKNLSDYKLYKKLKEQISHDLNKYVEEKGMVFTEIIEDNTLANIYLSYIDLLNSFIDRIEEEDCNEIRLIFSEFLNSKDPRIVELCINSLNNERFNKYRNETAMVLLYDYNNLQYPKDKEVMKLFIEEFGYLELKESTEILKNNLNSPDYEIGKLSADVLQKLTSERYTFSAKRKTFYDWNFINSLSEKKFAEIHTTKGIIKIKLFLEETPFTVANFIRLAESGFYNSTVFHRVIPNFVIQGGDPTGTGWGGPDYTIRTEIFNSSFETGAVGMASSGKDTEGSQFFIMHSPHYHLDGKYTLFGKVIEGMEIVDKIYIDDKILKITFSDI